MNPKTKLIPMILLMVATTTRAQAPRQEFFESRIRPVLAENCYRCHNSSGNQKGGLALDHREGLRRGGESGPALAPGRPEASLMLGLMRHEDDDRRMPEDGPKLSRTVIDDFTRWIKDGAIDPRDAPPGRAELERALSWEEVRKRRMKWWSWQPITDPPVPAGARHPVDAFLQARLDAAGIQPAGRAEPRTLLRRLYFTLTGLPPSTREIASFLPDSSTTAYEELVDRLLASPRFGERWARHWMDWLRYADSHGSEGDPAIPNAWRYRDYLIRALNTDVSFDQLIKEHIAGDLLRNPRIDSGQGINESVLGVAQLRFVQHGFAPTDALEERVRVIDNQIDVLSKAFLGVTVSCARCHDHKFDPIGQSDFYALYGVLASCRPAQLVIDLPDRLEKNRSSLEDVKSEIKERLGRAWAGAAESLPARLLEGRSEIVAEAVARSGKSKESPLYAWALTRKDSGPGEFEAHWKSLQEDWRKSRDRLSVRRSRSGIDGFDPSIQGDRNWSVYGTGLEGGPAPPGEFHVHPSGDRIVSAILPAGRFTHLLSDKHHGVLMSRRFRFGEKDIWLRVMGGGGAKARYVVQNYPRSGTVYPINGLKGGEERWIRWDVSYWEGDDGHLELSTAADQAVEANTGADRSWFGVTGAAFVSKEDVEAGRSPRKEAAELILPLIDAAKSAPPVSTADLARNYASALSVCVRDWLAGDATNEQTRFLDFFVRNELLPTRVSQIPGLSRLVAAYRELERDVPVSRRSPGVLEAEPIDQRMFIRGNHKAPGEPVPRRFLEAIDATPYRGERSGRLELAADFVRKDNPLTARVAVNRLWHHLFGQGLVTTPDNFGRLGAKPSHPALLDFLASRFIESGWSIKKLIRLIVTSEAFARSGDASRRALEENPANELHARFSPRRLEAEAIRDALLAVSGEIDLTAGGPPVSGTSRRRSVYLRVKRNALDPFLSAFDAPAPHSTHGRRETTNVPAQALMMLNDSFVREMAALWADAVSGDGDSRSDEERITVMFESALGRLPSAAERLRCRNFMKELVSERMTLSRVATRNEAALTEARSRIAARIAPIRIRLLDEEKRRSGGSPSGPTPVASWEFDGDLDDRLGQLHGSLKGTAHLHDGALVLDGRGHAQTTAIATDLAAKTLEVWVQLDDSEQRGGGVMTVQTVDGSRFDSIVFGEKQPGHWLAGSNFFERTQAFRGTRETEAGERAIHFVITYAEDGTIAAFRDGEPYGKPYRSRGPTRFKAGEAIIVFGLRHSPANDGKRLRGRLLRAQLYDRALGADEIRASGSPGFVPLRRIRAAMTDAQRDELERLERNLEYAREACARSGLPPGFNSDRRTIWRDFALSILSLEEFIYLR